MRGSRDVSSHTEDAMKQLFDPRKHHFASGSGGADPEAYDEVGRSPLYRALEGGHSKITQLLLEHGADPDSLNEDGETLLHIAPVFDDMKVVEGLLDLNADVNVKDNQGQTPYQIALEWKRSEIAQLLLKHGARVTSRPPSIHAQ
jgi:ankyrin repeat protein